ncbi:MAG TPA: recombinase family protein [Hymenobacter sp.]|jgi:hypothetical protein
MVFCYARVSTQDQPLRLSLDALREHGCTQLVEEKASSVKERGLFALFAAASLLAERWPGLEAVQVAASVGLIGTYLLNQRHCPVASRVPTS